MQCSILLPASGGLVGSPGVAWGCMRGGGMISVRVPVGLHRGAVNARTKCASRVRAQRVGHKVLPLSVCYKGTRWLGMHKQAGTRAGNHQRHTQQTPALQRRQKTLH